MVVMLTRGTDHELSSVAFTIACGGITSGMKVYAFLVSSAVDLVRRKLSTSLTSAAGPAEETDGRLCRAGGTIWACPPCVKARGYTQEDFIDGVTIQAHAMHERLKQVQRVLASERRLRVRSASSRLDAAVYPRSWGERNEP